MGAPIAKVLGHRLAADLPNAQLSQLADDPSVAEAGGFRDLDDQLPDLLWLPLTALGTARLGFSVLLLADPAVERGGRDDRDQFLDGPTDCPAVLEQPLAFLRFGVDLAADASPQNLVFLRRKMQSGDTKYSSHRLLDAMDTSRPSRRAANERGIQTANSSFIWCPRSASSFPGEQDVAPLEY